MRAAANGFALSVWTMPVKSEYTGFAADSSSPACAQSSTSPLQSTPVQYSTPVHHWSGLEYWSSSTGVVSPRQFYPFAAASNCGLAKSLLPVVDCSSQHSPVVPTISDLERPSLIHLLLNSTATLLPSDHAPESSSRVVSRGGERILSASHCLKRRHRRRHDGCRIHHHGQAPRAARCALLHLPGGVLAARPPCGHRVHRGGWRPRRVRHRRRRGGAARMGAWRYRGCCVATGAAYKGGTVILYLAAAAGAGNLTHPRRRIIHC